MKKQFICFALFLYATSLQASSLFDTYDLPTEQRGAGGSTPPADQEAKSSQLLFSTTPALSQDPLVAAQSDLIKTVTSRHLQPEDQMHHDPSAYAIACQTTMRNFTITTATPSNFPTTETAVDEHATKDDKDVTLFDDMDYLLPREISQLEQLALQGQTCVQQVTTKICELASTTRRLAERALYQEVDRIVKLRHEGLLSNALLVYESEAEKGAFLAKGLDQAVQSKRIDDITEMLNIIHFYKLRDFVPTDHQENAAKILLDHNKKVTIALLPETLRTSRPGDLSPRSKACIDMLKAIHVAYAPKSEASDLFAAQTLQHLKTLSCAQSSNQ